VLHPGYRVVAALSPAAVCLARLPGIGALRRAEAGSRLRWLASLMVIDFVRLVLAEAAAPRHAMRTSNPSWMSS